jgi:hypothetical protein
MCTMLERSMARRLTRWRGLRDETVHSCKLELLFDVHTSMSSRAISLVTRHSRPQLAVRRPGKQAHTLPWIFVCSPQHRSSLCQRRKRNPSKSSHSLVYITTSSTLPSLLPTRPLRRTLRSCCTKERKPLELMIRRCHLFWVPTQTFG